MVDTELRIKVTTDGNVRSIKEAQEAIEAIARMNKQAAATAAELGKRFNLSAKEVQALEAEMRQISQATAQAAKSAGTYRDSLGRLRDANGRFVKDAVSGFGDIKREAAGLNGVFGDIAQGIAQGLGQRVFDSIANGVGRLKDLGGAVLAAGEDFDAARAKVATLSDDTEALAAASLEVSDSLKNQASQTELLNSSYDVLSAGFSETADVQQILDASLQAAVGGFSDVNTVADATTSVLNAYGLGAENAAAITDKFVATQNAGKITVDQYAQQIGKLAPIAAQAGVGIDELNGFIATATAQGVQVESTFAGLRQAYAAILKPSAEAAELSKKIGVEFNAQALESKGLQGILAELNAVGADTPEILTQLFGSVEAVGAIAPSTGAGMATLAQNIEASANSAGTATEAFEKVADSLPGLRKQLENGFNNALTAAARSLEPAAQGILKTVSDIFNEVGNNFDGFDQLTTAAEGLQLALAENPALVEQLGAAFASLANTGIDQIVNITDRLSELFADENAVKGFAQDIESLGGVIEGLGSAAAIVIKITQFFQGLKGAISEIPVVGEGIADFLSPLGPVIVGVGKGLQAISNVIAELLNRLQVLPGVAAAIGGGFDQIGQGIGGPVLESANALSDALGSMGDKGEAGGQQAAEGVDQVVPAAEDAKSAIEELAGAYSLLEAEAELAASEAELALRQRGATEEEIAAQLQQFAEQEIALQERKAAELRAIAADASQSAEDRAAAEQQAIAAQDAANRAAINLIKERQEAQRKAAQEAAKAVTDQLETERDTQREAAEAAQAEQIEALKDSRAEQRRQDEAAFERDIEQRKSAFQKKQQAEAKAFQDSLDAERRRNSAELSELERAAERDFQLTEARRTGGRTAERELQDQFAEEDRQRIARIESEQRVLDRSGAIIANTDPRLLDESPLAAEARRRDEQLQSREESFNTQQAAQAEEFEAGIEAEKAAFEEDQRLLDAEHEQNLQEMERVFKAEQRALDEASAERIRQILEAADRGITPPALRTGGPVEAGGLYQVHKDEFFVPRTDGTILSQQASRAVIREALTARDAVAALAPSIEPAANGGAGGNVQGLEQRMDELIKLVKNKPPVNAPASFYVSSPAPYKKAISMDLDRIREIVKGAGW